ncbi:hypothetical protein [Psychrobacter glacincola]|uniref:hypothetical protein n=1 Tax=Psychrobacter glacincola TaxID=56810 RepID=UPI003CFF6EA8
MTYVIYDDYIDADTDSVSYKILSKSLLQPYTTLISEAILDDKNCDEVQSANNLMFLEYIETAISNYVSDYDFNLDLNVNSNYTCDCEGECDRNCYTNKNVTNSLWKAKKQFDFDLYISRALDYIDAEYQTSESIRIKKLAYPIAQTLLSREIGRWAFYHGFYEIGAIFNSSATLSYGCIIGHSKIDIDTYIATEISERSKKASDVRWQMHRTRKKGQKEEYLKIMKDKGFSTYSDTAAHIKLHVDTANSPSFPTICRLLSEADKGDFS